MSKASEFRRMRLGEEELRAVEEVFRRGELSPFFRNFLGGGKVREFEERFADYLGVEYAIATSSGTTALHTALLAAGVKRGWEVIVPPYTFVASVSMVIAAGGRPRFADVDPKTYNLDPDAVLEAITPKTRAIMPVHIVGGVCDMDAIMEIAEDHHLVVVEDSAQALGSKYKGRMAGTFGDAAIFSFQETKSLTTGGEGGMVVTNDPKIAERARYIRNHGDKYSPRRRNMMGYNYRMTEIAAAIGIVQLEKYKTLFLPTQIRNAKRLIAGLPEGIDPPYVPPEVEHTYLFVACQYDEQRTGVPRDKFLEEVTKRGLHKLQPGSMISGGYAELVYHLPYYRRWARPCPNAERLLKTMLYIDHHRWPNTEEDVDRLNMEFKRILEELRGEG